MSAIKGKSFTDNEMDILMLCVRQKPIIENKQTDKHTNMAKEKAWKDVEALFNAQSGGTFRNASSLKNKWALLKKRAKQEAAAIRYNSIATGGGPSTSKEPLPRIFEEVIGICSPMSIMGSSGGPCSDRGNYFFTDLFNNNKAIMFGREVTHLLAM